MKKIVSITALSFALFIGSCTSNNSSGKAGSDLNANKTAVSKDAQNASNATSDKCQGSRSVGCTCPQVLNPVCGCNGVTYDNGCEAECDGVVRYTFGRCPSGTGEQSTKPQPPRQ